MIQEDKSAKEDKGDKRHKTLLFVPLLICCTARRGTRLYWVKLCLNHPKIHSLARTHARTGQNTQEVHKMWVGFFAFVSLVPLIKTFPKKELFIMKERDIIAAIKAYIKSIPNSYCYKNHGSYFGQAGLPDLICCIGGRFIAFEVKTDIGKLTPLQAVEIRKIKEVGGTAEVVRSLDEARAVIERLQKE